LPSFSDINFWFYSGLSESSLKISKVNFKEKSYFFGFYFSAKNLRILEPFSGHLKIKGFEKKIGLFAKKH
jgi:putative methionine-R-sulfoxide reductase with GAF domain